MKYISAVIKGDRFEAAQAAAERGIPAVCIQDTRTSSGSWQAIIRVGIQFEDLMTAWHAEEPREPPYPIGACLVYSIHPGDES